MYEKMQSCFDGCCEALDWFELHPNRSPKDYMRALYYYGNLRLRLKDYSTAIYYLTRTQELAEKLDNPFYSGLAFREIGAAYILSFNYAKDRLHLGSISYVIRGTNAVQNLTKQGLTSITAC